MDMNEELKHHGLNMTLNKHKAIKLSMSNRYLLLLVNTIYILSLITVYHISSKYFAYTGFWFMGSLNSLQFIILVILAATPSLFLPVRLNKPSALVCWALYYVVYTPSAIIPFLVSSLQFSIILTFTLSTLAGLAILSATNRISLKIPTINLQPYSLALSVSFIIMILLMVLLIISQLWPIVNFSRLSHIYVQRVLYVQSMAHITVPGFGYLVQWLWQVVVPLMMLMGLAYKRYSLVSLGAAILVMLYGITAFKAVVALPFVILFLYFVLNKLPKFPLMGFAALFIMLMCVSMINYHVLNIFTRRVILMQGLLSAWYINFSLHNPLTYFSDSILKHWIDYPYGTLHIPFMVSYFNAGRSWDTNANIFATSVVQLGHIMGPITIATLLALFLSVYDAIALAIKQTANDKLYLVTIVLIAPFILALVNTSLPTALLTGGGLVSMGIIYLLLCTLPKNNSTPK